MKFLLSFDKKTRDYMNGGCEEGIFLFLSYDFELGLWG